MNKKIITKIWLIALIACPFVLWLLPANFFDNGTIPLCFSRIFFGIECLGCGMTRAVMHLHHLDFSNAYGFNKMVVIVYPLLVGLWGKWAFSAIQQQKN